MITREFLTASIYEVFRFATMSYQSVAVLVPSVTVKLMKECVELISLCCCPMI